MKAFPKTFGRTSTYEDDYRTVACMIAMACSRSGDHDRDASEDLPFKDRFLRCCRINYKTKDGNVHRDGRCGCRRFCPFCNFLKRQEALLTYVPAFDRGHWYSMTISSTTALDLETDELTHSWDAAKAVVRALLEAKHFLGAYWTEELHLESLYPEIRVLPHGHVLFHVVADVDEAAVQALAARTFRRYFYNLKRRMKRRNSDDGVALLKPDIDLVCLQTKNDLYGQCDPSLALFPEDTGSEAKESLYKWCDYLTKTLRVVDAYGAAMEAVPDEERWQANHNFEQFLSGLLVMVEEDSSPQMAGKQQRLDDGERPRKSKPRSRQQRHSLGTLRPGRSGKFVGVRPAQRHGHWRELEEIRQAIIVKQALSLQDADVEHAS